MPEVAAVASWMESLKIPIREIRKKYTKSELAIMGWRSREMSFNLQGVSNHHPQGSDSSTNLPDPKDLIPETVPDRVIRQLEERMGPTIVAKIEKAGEVDLRMMTGEEARQYMAVMGVSLPTAGVSRQTGEDDDVAKAYREEEAIRKQRGN